MNEKDDMITHLGILSNLENGRKLARFSNSPGTAEALVYDYQLVHVSRNCQVNW